MKKLKTFIILLLTLNALLITVNLILTKLKIEKILETMCTYKIEFEESEEYLEILGKC